MKRRLRMSRQTESIAWLFERVFIVGALLFFMDVALRVLQDPGDTVLDVQTSDPIHRVLNILVLMGAIFLMFPVRRYLLRALIANRALCALCFLVGLSSIWSPVPLFTIQRGIVFVMITMFGLYFGVRYDTQQQIRLVLNALVIATLLSCVFIVLLPKYGIDSAGAWRGAFIQKNIFARFLVITLVSVISVRVSGGHKVLMKALFLALLLCLLVKSRSVGAYAMAMVSIVLIYSSLLVGMQRRKLIPILLLGVPLTLVVAGCLWVGRVELLSSASRDASLTGRVPLWDAVMVRAVKEPFLGYGYGGFWSTQSSQVWSAIRTGHH